MKTQSAFIIMVVALVLSAAATFAQSGFASGSVAIAAGWQRLARGGLSPVESAAGQAAGTRAESPPDWGGVVEGVQVRLQANETKWKAGAVPRLFVDVRNQGTRHLLVQTKQMHGCELQVDGQWFRRPAYTLEVRARPSPFPPGREYDGIVINLDGLWEAALSQDVRRSSRTVPERLKLTPGKHLVRIAVTATPGKSDLGPPVRAISNSIEVEIASPAAQKTRPRNRVPTLMGITRPSRNQGMAPATAPAAVGSFLPRIGPRLLRAGRNDTTPVQKRLLFSSG